MINNKYEHNYSLTRNKHAFTVLLIFILMLSMIFVNSCLGNDEGEIEYGIFEGIPIIEILEPTHKSTVSETPNFKWVTTRTGRGIFPYELVIIFKYKIEVDGISFTVDTLTKDAVWIWDSNRPTGVPGCINLSDFVPAKTQEIANGEYIFVFEDGNQEEKPNLEDYIKDNPELEGKDFYWVVIQYNSKGKINRASKEFSFLFKDDEEG